MQDASEDNPYSAPASTGESALRKCLKCGFERGADANACPRCGAVYSRLEAAVEAAAPKQAAKGRSRRAWILACVLVVIGVLVAVFLGLPRWG